MVISAVTVWIPMWLSLDKIFVFNFSLLDKPMLKLVYTRPPDVSLDLVVTMCEP